MCAKWKYSLEQQKLQKFAFYKFRVKNYNTKTFHYIFVQILGKSIHFLERQNIYLFYKYNAHTDLILM